MKTTLRMATLAMMLGLALVLVACGGGGGASSGGGAAAPAPTGSLTIEIAADGENLAFDKTTLTVGAGQQVTLNFNNVSVAQQHNWVLVNGGEDVASAVAMAGLTAGLAGEYLPADRSQIIAHTAVLNGGQKGSVSFTAPGPGIYLYICTVPGHYPLMQGTLTVN